MTIGFVPKLKVQSQTFEKFIAPLLKLLPFVPELLSRGDRPLKMTFEDQLKALVYFHLQEHKSARHLIQDMKESDFAKQNIAPDGGLVAAASQRQSTTGVLNNYNLFLRTFINRRQRSFLKDTKNWETSCQLMVVSLMPYCQCIGLTTEKAPKKLKLIANLTLIMESQTRSSLQKAMVVNALLLIKS